MHRKAATRIASVVLVASVIGACSIGLSASVEGKACKDGQCLTGYHCDTRSNTCVSDMAGSGGTGAIDGTSGSGGTGGQVMMDAAGGTVMLDANDAAMMEDADASIGTARDSGKDAIADTGATVGNGVLCHDQPCNTGDLCCVTDFPGYPNLPPSDAFSCTTDTSACQYALFCDSDLDCPPSQVCCSSQGSNGWVAQCADSCDTSSSVHVGCTRPEHCESGTLCCGDYNALSERFTEISCQSDCSGIGARVFCNTSADCPAFQCVDASSIPGFHICY